MAEHRYCLTKISRPYSLNLRPHRPPTRSGRVALFTTIEDETEYLQATCVNEALDQYAAVFLLSPAVVVRGILQRKGVGASLLVEKAKPLPADYHRAASPSS